MSTLVQILALTWAIVAAAVLIVGHLRPRRHHGPSRRRTDPPADLPALLQEQAD